jgi:hypothetical protein
MTYQQKILDHLVMMAKLDKAYAWHAAKQYQLIDPYQLADICEKLIAVMRKLQSSSTTERPAAHMGKATK